MLIREAHDLADPGTAERERASCRHPLPWAFLDIWLCMQGAAGRGRMWRASPPQRGDLALSWADCGAQQRQRVIESISKREKVERWL